MESFAKFIKQYLTSEYFLVIINSVYSKSTTRENKKIIDLSMLQIFFTSIFTICNTHFSENTNTSYFFTIFFKYFNEIFLRLISI